MGLAFLRLQDGPGPAGVAVANEVLGVFVGAIVLHPAFARVKQHGVVCGPADDDGVSVGGGIRLWDSGQRHGAAGEGAWQHLCSAQLLVAGRAGFRKGEDTICHRMTICFSCLLISNASALIWRPFRVHIEIKQQHKLDKVSTVDGKA